MRKVRVLKYVVQPVLVVDDGETLEEVKVQPVEVSAGKLVDFVTETLTAEIAKMEQQLNPDEA